MARSRSYYSKKAGVEPNHNIYKRTASVGLEPNWREKRHEKIIETQNNKLELVQPRSEPKSSSHKPFEVVLVNVQTKEKKEFSSAKELSEWLQVSRRVLYSALNDTHRIDSKHFVCWKHEYEMFFEGIEHDLLN